MLSGTPEHGNAMFLSSDQPHTPILRKVAGTVLGVEKDDPCNASPASELPDKFTIPKN